MVSLSLMVAEMYSFLWKCEMGTTKEVNETYEKAWNAVLESGARDRVYEVVKMKYLEWIKESGQPIPPHLHCAPP